MAGQKEGVFPQHISPFLNRYYQQAQLNSDHELCDILQKEYHYDSRESLVANNQTRRHYEAEVHAVFEGVALKGVEKLYRRTILIEPTTICAANCRWCLRGQYDILHLSEEELKTIARYCGEAPENREVREVLITGGDPLMVPNRLLYLLEMLQTYAPQIQIYRIGSRVPLQDPARINANLLKGVARFTDKRIEIGLQTNHPRELFPEVRTALGTLSNAGVVLYNQSVLLKGINDHSDTLYALCDELRYLKVETHYLFHCIPMRGLNHFRTSLDRGIALARQLTSSGRDSGRSKPMFTLLTDIGKITLYEGTILQRDGQSKRVLLQSAYRYDERMAWCPSWKLPENAQVDNDGYLQVWYLDDGE